MKTFGTLSLFLVIYSFTMLRDINGECKFIEDPTSVFRQTIPSNEWDTHFETAAAHLSPEVRQCIGSIDMTDFVPELVASLDSQCFELHAEFESLQTQLQSSMQTQQDPPNFFSIIQMYDDKIVQQMCSHMKKGIDCVGTAMSFIQSKLQSESVSSCCAPAVLTVQQALGAEVASFVPQMLNHVHTLLCSAHTPGSIMDGSQTCFTTMLRSLFAGINSERDLIRIVPKVQALLQMPNDEGCKAYTGDVFTDTSGEENSALVSNPIDICSKNIDTLVSAIKDIPVLQDVVLVQDLLADGKFLDGNSLHSSVMEMAAGSDDPSAVYLTFASTILLKGKKLHIANGFSGSCSYSSTSSLTYGLATNDGKSQNLNTVITNAATSTTWSLSYVNLLLISLLVFAF